MATLADEILAQQKRVREQVLPAYIAMRGMPGVNVEFAIGMMNAALTMTEKAVMEQDTVAMLRCCEELKGFNT